MLQDQVSNPGPLTYESGALPIALCGPAASKSVKTVITLGRFLPLFQIKGHLLGKNTIQVSHYLSWLFLDRLITVLD